MSDAPVRTTNQRRALALWYGKQTPRHDTLGALGAYSKQIASTWQTEIEFAQALCPESALETVKARKPEMVLLSPPWNASLEELSGLLDLLRAQTEGSPRLVLMDFCDATCSPFLPLLAKVDLYVKSHLLRDRRQYLQPMHGGYWFTDFLVRQLGWNIGDWQFGAIAPAAHLHKLRAGWTWGVARRYHLMARLCAAARIPWRLRSTDVNRRFRPPQRDSEQWYDRHRRQARDLLEPLGGRYRLSGYDRITYKKYVYELLTSKIVVSPFGWGEVCYRDYETVAAGALLIKPDMSHLATHPDIYLPYETYVPVRWDLADLEQTVDYYLTHPRAAQRIAANGQKRLMQYFSQKEFVKNAGDFLS